MSDPKSERPVIEGKLVSLRLLEEDDLENLRTWRNDSRHSFFNSDIITADGQRRWFENVYQKKPDDLIFVIETGEGEPVGAVSLYDFKPKEKQAEYGRMVVSKEHRRNGYAQDASEALIEFGFDELGLDRVVLGVVPSNRLAIDLYEKMGFKVTKRGKDETRMVLDKEVRPKAKENGKIS